MKEYKLLMCEFREYFNPVFEGENINPKSSQRCDYGTFTNLDDVKKALIKEENQLIKNGWKQLEDANGFTQTTSRYKAVRIYKCVQFDFKPYF